MPERKPRGWTKAAQIHRAIRFYRGAPNLLMGLTELIREGYISRRKQLCKSFTVMTRCAPQSEIDALPEGREELSA